MFYLLNFFKKFFLFTLIALLVVQCQKDDANTNVESEQLKKELSRAQLEERIIEIANSQEFQDLIKPRKEGQSDEMYYDKVLHKMEKFGEKYPDFDRYMASVASEMLESGRLEITALDDSSGKLYKYSLRSKKKVNEVDEKTETRDKESEERRWGSYCPDRCDSKKRNCKSVCGQRKSGCDYGVSFNYGVSMGICNALSSWNRIQCVTDIERKRDRGYAQCKNNYNSCVNSCERDYGNCMFDCEYSK